MSIRDPQTEYPCIGLSVLGPVELLCTASSAEKTVYKTELSRSTCNAMFDLLHHEVLQYLNKSCARGMGGPERMVCVDGTFLTRHGGLFGS